MTTAAYTCLIMDDNQEANDHLITLLRQLPKHVTHIIFSATSFLQAAEILQAERIDLLFIRITWWDDYRKIITEIENPPATVIFLSGLLEKGTYHILGEIDFHLQPPYRTQSLSKIFTRLANPDFLPLSLEIFFLRAGSRPHVIPLSSLRSVTGKKGFCTVQTDTASYTVAASLLQFERRLPKQFFRINRHLLVAWDHLAPSGSLPSSRRKLRQAATTSGLSPASPFTTHGSSPIPQPLR